MPDARERLLTLHDLAEILHLPAVWLKDEALAGRIPALRVGRRLRFNAGAVEQALAERAACDPKAVTVPIRTARHTRRPR